MERQGPREPREEARLLLSGRPEALGGRVFGRGSGIISKHFLSKEKKVYSTERILTFKAWR